MRTFLALVVLLSFPATALAQERTEFPDYTDQQLWARASLLGVISITASIRHAKDTGQSVEEFAHWWADLFDDGWGEPGSGTPVSVMRGMRRNWLTFPDARVEIMEASDDKAVARVNRPYAGAFGDNGMLYGVSLAEFEQVFSIFNHDVAEYLGLRYEERREGDDLIWTFMR